jgi:hypothetical protein
MNVPKVDYLANDINPKSIRITWDPLNSTDWTKTGGDDVIYYELQWDQGTYGTNWTTLT